MKRQTLYNNVQCCIKEIPNNHKESFICWHPSETKHFYLSTFSILEWNALAPEDKTNHTLRDCQICQTKYQHLSISCSNFIEVSVSKVYINTI